MIDTAVVLEALSTVCNVCVTVKPRGGYRCGGARQQLRSKNFILTVLDADEIR